MYLPEHFIATRADTVHGLSSHYPLDKLLALRGSGLQNDHIPFESVTGPWGVLRSHAARVKLLMPTLACRGVFLHANHQHNEQRLDLV